MKNVRVMFTGQEDADEIIRKMTQMNGTDAIALCIYILRATLTQMPQDDKDRTKKIILKIIREAYANNSH